MKKLIFFLCFFLNLCLFFKLNARTEQFHVNSNEVYKGFIVEKILLQQYAQPEISISNITFNENSSLPKDAKPTDPTKFTVRIGMERKKIYAFIRIPVYSLANATGTIRMLSDFTLTINESTISAKNKSALRTTDKQPSVLASGNWYKIGITATGFYKIDYNFINSLGINPSTVNPADIRIFGNGGKMLSEDNSISRYNDLQENSIWVNASGSSFASTDFAVFYGVGTTNWIKDSTEKLFMHQNNLYADTAYYFITFNKGAGARIAGQTFTGTPNVTVNSYNYYDVHDLDLINPVKLGKVWYGEQFNPILSNLFQTFTFNPGTTIDSVLYRISMGSTCDISGSCYDVSVNGANTGTSPIANATTGDDLMSLSPYTNKVACYSSSINIGIKFNPADAVGLGYLDYVEINGRSPLTLTGNQINFRDWNSVGAGNIANYQLQGANASTQVWDVTNPQIPVLMNGNFSSGTFTFLQDASYLHEFAAFSTTNFKSPKYIGVVPNQNLHDSAFYDCIIVTYPDFLEQANRLKAYHEIHDNMKVIVATTTQIYNEFSSGGQDISAIRDFEKMYYDRAGVDSTLMPKYVLLFGGASYDYKNRVANNSNYIPVFESASSTNDLNSFSTDDFYAFLDDNENIENYSVYNIMDIGVGRLPARSVADATVLVNKIINYTKDSTLGPWRISATFAADNNDAAGNHMDDAEYMAATVTNNTGNLYNEGKVYVDALPVISTPAGSRCPDANAGINNQIYKGTFLVNYNGHGNTEVWASERILTQDDFNNWNNANMLPFMVTATCDFGQFDQPSFVSAAEQLTLRNGGGVIAMLTTTQAVYAVYNVIINSNYLKSQFTKNPDGSWNTFGDASRKSKNITFSTTMDSQELINFRKFSLLGDPALTPDFPKYNIVIDSILDASTMHTTDTVMALGAYILNGTLKDLSNKIMQDFNGTLYVTFYEQARTIKTISGTNESFKIRDNVIYKGIVSVINGHFSFTFITPKDINYSYGKGKISTYADNGNTDAAGADTSYYIGGYSAHPVISTDTPIVKVYINDTFFKEGGLTGTNTSLFVALQTETGINVSGNTVGHDLIALLDGNKEAPYLLNDFYQTAPNTYKKGYAIFPISGIPDGKHTLFVRAWDVNDNTGTGYIDFYVMDGRIVDIQNLTNYPNPFSNSTYFVFEHNHPNEQLNAKIEIYNIAGALVKKIEDTFTPTGSVSREISWDGTDENGARLPSGVYVYRINITSDKGFISSAYQKLVIVR